MFWMALLKQIVWFDVATAEVRSNWQLNGLHWITKSKNLDESAHVLYTEFSTRT